MGHLIKVICSLYIMKLNNHQSSKSETSSTSGNTVIHKNANAITNGGLWVSVGGKICIYILSAINTN